MLFEKYDKRKLAGRFMAGVLVSLLMLFALAGCSPSTARTEKAEATPAQTADTQKQAASQNDGKDLVISVGDVSEKALFIPVEVDGVKLEVIAVKAPDGSIRTAFNTCQVCYDSGKGYYKQEGDELVCQNCGNRFGMGDVEVTKGGCNPVPIPEKYKTVTADTITIPYDLLKEAKTIFSNWKA